VTLLRWTHDNIEQFLNYRHGENNEVLPQEDRSVIYSTFDELFRGACSQADISPCEVVLIIIIIVIFHLPYRGARAQHSYNCIPSGCLEFSGVGKLFHQMALVMPRKRVGHTVSNQYVMYSTVAVVATPYFGQLTRHPLPSA
jgi:hypothetical protein